MFYILFIKMSFPASFDQSSTDSWICFCRTWCVLEFIKSHIWSIRHWWWWMVGCSLFKSMLKTRGICRVLHPITEVVYVLLWGWFFSKALPKQLRQLSKPIRWNRWNYILKRWFFWWMLQVSRGSHGDAVSQTKCQFATLISSKC
jgi:hypothetical protein